jgi:DNA primase
VIPEDVIAEVKRRVDIGNVIGRTVKLKKSGRNLVGLCPFHSEKSPSFNVRADEGFYKCFGCGAAGDVFTFLEQSTGQRFIDVLRGLAAESGVDLPEEQVSPDEQRRREERQRLLRVLELSQIFFRQKIIDDDEGRMARLYLKDQRGLDEEVIDAFGLGFGGASDKGLVSFLAGQGVDELSMRAAGVVADGHSGAYDFFRQRITFPIRGRRGEVLTFGGRAFGRAAEGRPKYVNGPSTSIYDKSRDLYGLNEAMAGLKRGKPAVLVEGYLDVIAVHRAGLPTALAPCGTSLTALHLDEVARHTGTLIVCMDADDAGRAASERAVLMAIRKGLDVRLAELVDKDPDEMMKKGEKALLLSKLEGAKDAVDVLVTHLLEKAVGRIGNRTAALEGALPFLAALPMERLSSKAIVGRVAQVMGVDKEALLKDVQARGGKLLQGILGGDRRPPDDGQGRAGTRPSTTPRSPEAAASQTALAKAAPVDENAPRASQAATDLSRAARVLVSRSAVTWTEAEKSLARALLCQPQLAPRCGVLVDAFKNRELKAFVVALTDALVRYHEGTPRDVLKRVPVTPAIARIYADIFTRRGVDDPDHFLPEGAAARIIEDFVLTLEKRPLEKRLGEIQRAIQSASDRGDLETARHLIETQRAVILRLSVPEGRSEPRQLKAREQAEVGPPAAAVESVGGVAADQNAPTVAPLDPDNFAPDPVEGDDDEDETESSTGGPEEEDDEELW